MTTIEATLQHALQQTLAARARAHEAHQREVDDKPDGLWEFRLYGATASRPHAATDIGRPEHLERLVPRSLRSRQAMTPAMVTLAARSPGRVQKRLAPGRTQLGVASRARAANASSPGGRQAHVLSASQAGESSRVTTAIHAASPANAASPITAASPIVTLTLPPTPGRYDTRFQTTAPETLRLDADPRHAVAGTGNFGSVYRASSVDQRGRVIGMQCVALKLSELSDAAA